MGLELLQLLGAQAAKFLQSVGPTFGLDRVQRGNFAQPRGHDQLAAFLVDDAVLVAEAVKGFTAGHAVLGLERSRLVVQAGMDHAAVVAGLVGGQLAFGLEDDDRVHPGPDQGHGRGQADDAAADDGHVVYALAHCSLLLFQPFSVLGWEQK